MGDTGDDAASDASADATSLTPDASTLDAALDAPPDAPAAVQDAGPADAANAADAAPDAPPDAPADAADAGCHPCLVGDARCVSGALASCIAVDGDGGCTTFSPPIACGANALCQERLYRAWCACQPGAVDDGSGAGCVQVIGAPRLIGPLSTATVTTRNPTLRWELAPGTDGAQIDLCWDRACDTYAPLQYTASGSSITLSSAVLTSFPGGMLDTGVQFWRARGMSAGRLGTATSPVWEFFVGARDAANDTSWGTTPDVDGDGYPDVIIGNTNPMQLVDVVVYPGGSSGIGSTPTVVHGFQTGFGEFGVLGTTIASAGDVNGDGYSDVVLGIGSYNSNFPVGAVNLMLGGPGGLAGPGTQVLAEGINSYQSSYGTVSVVAVGDVNGDGYADVLTTGGTVAPEAYLLTGGPTGLSTTPITLTSPGSGGSGAAVAAAGDVNGDGYGDFLVSFWGDGTYLYLGGSGGPQSPVAVSGGAGGCAGDVNGDGFADLFSGAGVAFGGPSGLATTSVSLAASVDGGAAASLGCCAEMTAAGDVDGDGYGDIVGGAPHPGTTAAGRVYLFKGGPNGPTGAPIEVDGSGSNFGVVVSGAGDVNLDGYADILAGDTTTTAIGGGPSMPQGTVSLVLSGKMGFVTPPVVMSSFWAYSFQ